jgi:GH15 family glucan-1,4-alpha-glucosidase
MPFPKGVSGNPEGRRKNRPWRDALNRAVQRATTGKVDYVALDALADALVAAGLAGEVNALKEIGDRIDGKVPQAIVGDDDESPVNVVHKIVREIVEPNSQNRDG